MSQTFKAEKTNVGTLFGQQYFFRVPAYQRPFLWDKENFENLIDDVTKADRNSEYFLGTIVLHKTDDKNNYDVVDGQQRISALAILIASLRDYVSDPTFQVNLQEKLVQRKNKADGIPEKNRVEVKDTTVFNAILSEHGGTNDIKLPAKPTPSTIHYAEAADVFKTELAKFSQDELESIIEFLSQRCVLICLAASNFEEAFKLFTIVNDRGKQLRRVDILKAANLDPTVITKATVREKLAHTWEALENDVGEDSFESVFFLLRLILIKDKPQSDLFTEFDKRVFKAGEVAKGEKFLELAFEYVRLYKSLFLDFEFMKESDPDYSRFVSLMHIMDSEFGASEWKATILHYAKKFGSAGIYDFTLAIEKVFLSHWVKNTRKDERYSTYTSILGKIDQSDSAGDVIASIVVDDKAILADVGRRNMYSAAYGKYALLRLELLASELDQPRFIKAKSVEHVLPQDPDTGGEWAKTHDLTKIDEYVHSIGNLVLLSKGRNSSASNKEFSEKKTKYLAPRVSDYPRSVGVLAEPVWTREVIEKRTADAASRFLDRP